MRLQRGLTLVELLIVVAIVGILATIAYPSYQNYTRKSHRSAAQTEMLKIADRQTQYLLDARNYAVGPTALADLSVAIPAAVSSRYTITVKNAADGDTPSTPPSYTVTATPVAGSSQATDGVLTLTHTGVKTHAGTPGW
jgi:type IV pilus assembly protein PilE